MKAQIQRKRPLLSPLNASNDFDAMLSRLYFPYPATIKF